MCKILAVTNFSALSKKTDLKPSQILETCKTIVTVHNNDGFGFGISSKDEIFTYHQVDTDIPISDKKINYNSAIFDLDTIEQKTNIKKINDAFLLKSDIAIFHGRTSTNLSGIDYCHPFSSENNCLVHNGVVELSDIAFDEIEALLETENDTEQLFHLWEKSGLESIADLYGYYAFYNLKKTEKGNVLEFLRDDTAEQYGLCIDSIYIFATTRHMIESLLDVLGLEKYAPHIVAVKNNTYFQINAAGEISEHVNIKPNKDQVQLTAKEKLAFKDYKTSGMFDDEGGFFDDDSEGDYLSTEFNKVAKSFKAS